MLEKESKLPDHSRDGNDGVQKLVKYILWQKFSSLFFVYTKHALKKGPCWIYLIQ